MYSMIASLPGQGRTHPRAEGRGRPQCGEGPTLHPQQRLPQPGTSITLVSPGHSLPVTAPCPVGGHFVSKVPYIPLCLGPGWHHLHCLPCPHLQPQLPTSPIPQAPRYPTVCTGCSPLWTEQWKGRKPCLCAWRRDRRRASSRVARVASGPRKAFPGRCAWDGVKSGPAGPSTSLAALRPAPCTCPGGWLPPRRPGLVACLPH